MAAAKAQAKPIPKRSGSKIAVFIDLDNTNASLTNVLEIISHLKNIGSIAYGKLYGYTDDRAAEFEEVVREHKFETAGKMRYKAEGVSVVDARLVLECTTAVSKKKFDAAFVWAGVGDLVPLFAGLKELGLKTLTVDLPEFDCKNKFVDQALRLFSPHTLTVQRTREEAVQEQPEFEEEPRQRFSIPEIDLDNVPVLPRKENAPEFGAKMSAKPIAVDNVNDMSPEEAEKYYLRIAAQTWNQYQEETREEEMADLAPVPEEFESPDSAKSSYEAEAFKYDPTDSPVLNYNEPVEEAKSEFNDFGDVGSLAGVPTGKGE